MEKSQAIALAQRAKATLMRVKEETKEITGRTLSVAEATAAGFAVGAVRKRFGTGAAKEVKLFGTSVDADLAIGVGLSVLGISGLADELSPHCVALGGGTLAGWAALHALNETGAWMQPKP